MGREALKHKRYERADMFYRLALEYPDAAKDKSAKCAALRALSDIAYKSNKYVDCLSKGKECFQVSPVKLEVSVNMPDKIHRL